MAQPPHKPEPHQAQHQNGVPRQPPTKQASDEMPERGIKHPDGTVSLRNGVPPPEKGK